MDFYFPIDKSLSKNLALLAEAAEENIRRNNNSVQELRLTIITSNRKNLLALKAFLTECIETERNLSNNLIALYLQLIDRQLNII